MRAFIHFFFGQGTEPEFSMFTPAHFLPILVAAGLIFLIYRFRSQLRQSKRESVFRYIIAFTLIISEMAYYWRLVGMPELGPNPVENLPLAVCGWAAIFCSYLVIGKSQTLFDICYFWLFSGSFFALLTPTVLTYAGPARFRYYQFWTEHLSIYVAIFYMMFVHKMRPTIKSAVKSWLALLVLALISYFTNQYVGNGANYLFLARPEAAPSVLDILPPNFALRTAIMAAAITALFALSYLPWYLKDRKAKKVTV